MKLRVEAYTEPLPDIADLIREYIINAPTKGDYQKKEELYQLARKLETQETNLHDAAQEALKTFIVRSPNLDKYILDMVYGAVDFPMLMQDLLQDVGFVDQEATEIDKELGKPQNNS